METPGGLAVTQFDDEGGLADQIIVYDGESMSTVQVDWLSSEWPDFQGAVGNSLIVIHGSDAWVGELFQD